jgi:hypothetical protein
MTSVCRKFTTRNSDRLEPSEDWQRSQRRTVLGRRRPAPPWFAPSGYVPSQSRWTAAPLAPTVCLHRYWDCSSPDYVCYEPGGCRAAIYCLTLVFGDVGSLLLSLDFVVAIPLLIHGWLTGSMVGGAPGWPTSATRPRRDWM